MRDVQVNGPWCFPCWTFLDIVQVNGPWVNPCWTFLDIQVNGPWCFPCWTFLDIVQVNGPWVIPCWTFLDIQVIPCWTPEKNERSRYFWCGYRYKLESQVLLVLKTPPPQIPCQREVKNMCPFILKLRRGSLEKVDL